MHGTSGKIKKNWTEFYYFTINLISILSVLQLFNTNEDQEIRRCDAKWRFSIKSRIHRLQQT